jgi:hypothetical protein
MKYVCGLPFAIFETWYWVSPWGNRVNFPWWCAFNHWSAWIHFCKHSWGSYSEHMTKYVWTIFWAEKDAKILVQFYCHLLVKHMKTITFWHIHNIEILSCVPLSMHGCKIKVILLMLNSMCLCKPFCLNMAFWGIIQTFLSSLEPLIRCHFFVVVFNSTILKVDCERLYCSQCINLLSSHIPYTVFTDLPFLVTF